MMDCWMWAREFKEADGSRPGILESIRWIEGYERVAEAAAKMPGTRLVYIADREADILGMMQRAHALETPADWMVLSKHNPPRDDPGDRHARRLPRPQVRRRTRRQDPLAGGRKAPRLRPGSRT